MSTLGEAGVSGRERRCVFARRAEADTSVTTQHEDEAGFSKSCLANLALTDMPSAASLHFLDPFQQCSPDRLHR